MIAAALLSIVLAAVAVAPAAAPARAPATNPGAENPAAAHPSVTLSLTPSPKLTVGDPFDVTLVVRAPHRSLIIGPLADSTGVFVVSGESRKTTPRAEYDESIYRLKLAAFAPGCHPLPAFVFVAEGAGKSLTLQSAMASVTIASVLPQKMRDIHGLAPPESFPNLLLWLIPAALLLVALLGWLGRRLYLKYRRNQELAAAPLPPWEEALATLDAMPWREWLEAGQFKRYYYALSQVLKRYIERRFEFHAVEQTTTEMLASMRVHKTPMREDVARFFTRSDLVKYAKTVPLAEEAESAIAEVREFVHKTKPQEPAPAPATAGTSPAPASGGARA